MRLNSPLRLQLHFIDDRGARQPAGSTVASRTPEIPTAPVWLIQPLQTLNESDWDSLFALMRDLRIPGLLAHNKMTDALLERVAQLEHMTFLGFAGSRSVTDAGLQHLARLPSLQHLDASCPSARTQCHAVLAFPRGYLHRRQLCSREPVAIHRIPGRRQHHRADVRYARLDALASRAWGELAQGG